MHTNTDTHPYFVTPHGLALLQNSFAETQTKLRELTAVMDAVVRDSNNPEENSAAEEAVRERGILQMLSNQLSGQLQNARVFHPVDDGKFKQTGPVTFGCRIGLKASDGYTRVFDIVGEHEADIKQGKIAYTAPPYPCRLGMRTRRRNLLECGRQRSRLRNRLLGIVRLGFRLTPLFLYAD